MASSLPSRSKATHISVHYGKGMPQAHCSICVHYIAPKVKDAPGHCHLVRDPIGRGDWCSLFKHQSG